MIAATPFFITRLGAEQYGLWMLINVIVQVMNGLNFGVGESTIKAIAQHEAKGSYKHINTAFNQNLSLSVIMAIACSVAGLIAGIVIHRFSLFNIPASYSGVIVMTIFLFSLSTGIKFIEQVFVSVFKGLQRFDVSSRLMISSRLTYLLGVIIAVLLGSDITGIIKVSLGVSLANLIVQAAVVYAYSPVKSIVPKFALPRFSGLIQTNGWYWLQSVIALFGFLSDRIIIAQLTDLKTVGYYSIAALVGSQIHNILLALGGFVFPKVASATALGKNITQVYYLSRFIIAISGWLVILFLLLAGDFLFEWWLGEAVFRESISYIRLYLAFTAAIILIIIPFHFINGTPKVRLNTLFEIILRISHVAGMLAGYYFYGMTGLLCMLTGITLINIPFQYYVFHRAVLNIGLIHDAFIVVLPALIISCMVMFPPGMSYIFVPLFVVLVYFIYYKRTGKAFRELIKRSIE